MSIEPNPKDPRNIWQNQEVEHVTITLDAVRRRAARFERRIHWRNVREYVAGAVAVALLALTQRGARGWLLIPPLLLIAGVVYMLVEVHRRGSAQPAPSDAGLTAAVEFQRRQLERQRDALRSVATWYLLPIVPGCLATLVIAAAEHGMNIRIAIAGAAMALFFGLIWALNQWAARNLDRQVAELKALESNA